MAALTPLQRRPTSPALAVRPLSADPAPLPAPPPAGCPTAQSAYYELLASCQRDHRWAWVQQLRAEGPPQPAPEDGALGWLAFRDHHRTQDTAPSAARITTP